MTLPGLPPLKCCLTIASWSSDENRPSRAAGRRRPRRVRHRSARLRVQHPHQLPARPGAEDGKPQPVAGSRAPGLWRDPGQDPECQRGIPVAQVRLLRGPDTARHERRGGAGLPRYRCFQRLDPRQSPGIARILQAGAAGDGASAGCLARYPGERRNPETLHPSANVTRPFSSRARPSQIIRSACG